MRGAAPFLMLICLLCVSSSFMQSGMKIPTTPIASMTSSFTCFTTMLGMFTGGLGGGLF